MVTVPADTSAFRSLLISREGYWIFLDRPVSATLVAVNALLFVAMIYLTIKSLGEKNSELSKECTQTNDIPEPTFIVPIRTFAPFDLA